MNVPAKMDEKKQTSKISLKSSKKLIFYDAYKLIVPNFFTLPEYKNSVFDVDSQSFEFDNATWCFRCYSTTPSNTLDVNIIRLKTGKPEHKFSYKITLLDNAGMKYDDKSYACNINKSSNCAELGHFYQSNSFSELDTLNLVIHLFQFETTEVNATQPTGIKNVPEKIDEKKEASKISLESLKKSISYDVYTLLVPNFLFLAEYKDDDFVMDSPSFQFDNATWCFRCYSISKTTNSLYINIVRLKTEIPEHKFCCKITLSDGAGREYNDKNYVMCNINKSSDSAVLGIFSSDNSFGELDTLTLVIHLFQFETTEVNTKKETCTKIEKATVQSEISKKSEGLNSSGIGFETQNSNSLTDSTLGIRPTSTVSTNFAPAVSQTSIAPVNSGFGFGTAFTSPLKTATGFAFGTPAASTAGTSVGFGTAFTSPLKTATGFSFGTPAASTAGTSFEFTAFTTPSTTITGLTFASISPFSSCESKGAISTSQSSSSSLDLDLLSRDFKELFLNGVDCDLTLRVTGKEFQVHRVILRARSQVFQAMLCHDMIEKNKGIIDIPDIDAQAMEFVLIYLYSGEVGSLNHNNVFGVYYAADKYNLTSLKNKCAEFMKTSLTTSIICDVIQLALKHDDRDLLECCTKYFVKNVTKILPTVEWIAFLKSNPITANELYIKANKKQLYLIAKNNF